MEIGRRQGREPEEARGVPGAAAPELSVVIPAYNEERRLGPTLQRILDYLGSRRLAAEILVVDDGSRDRTVAVAERLLPPGGPHRVLRREENRGKGYTVRQGMLAGRGRFLLFSDADLSTPIEEVERLLPLLERGECQVAFGSRSLAGSRVEVHQPWWRENMGKAFNLFVRLIALRGFQDTQCGFKCFTRQAARAVFRRQRLDGFGFDVEALFIARRLGLTLREVPVRWVNSPDSRVNPLTDASRMLLDLLRIRCYDLLGRYGAIAGEEEG